MCCWMNNDEWYYASRLEHRIPKDLINQKIISRLSHLSEFRVEEECENSEQQNVILKIDLSKYLPDDFNFQDYLVYKYGNKDFKQEKSIYGAIKGHQFKNKKCDISFILVNKLTGGVLFFIGEIKYSLTTDQFFKAREQVVSSLIDLNILCSLMHFSSASIQIECIIFTVNNNRILPQAPVSIISRKYKQNNGRSTPLNFLLYEYHNRKILCSIDTEREMHSFDERVLRGFKSPIFKTLDFRIEEIGEDDIFSQLQQTNPQPHP